jgi:hypothetical protein
MQQSDLEGIARSGALARQRGISFHSNPHYSALMGETEADMLEWNDVANAWSAGWLREDAGRDKEIARLMLMRYW